VSYLTSWMQSDWWHVKCAYERVRYRNDRTALWDYHSYMLGQAIKILPEIMNHGGIPIDPELAPITEDGWEYANYEEGRAAWKSVLSDILMGFEADLHVHDNGITIDSPEYLAQQEALADRAWELYVKWRHHLWT